MNERQKSIINDWINTSNYVYNKTVETIKNGHKINFQNLRDLLVTNNTKKNHNKYKEFADLNKPLHLLKKELNKKLKSKKINIDEKNKINKELNNLDLTINNNKINLRNEAKKLNYEKNNNINEWELNTPKEVRANAVNDVCKAYKTAFSNLKKNNINHFDIGYRKNYSTNKCVVIPKNFVSIINSDIQIAPDFLNKDCLFKIGKKTLKKNKKIIIENDTRIVKQKNVYWILIPVSEEKLKREPLINYCGIDPGVRTFMTTFGNNGCTEYKHNKILLDKLNKKIFYLKDARLYNFHNKRVALNKLENKKDNIINELHWKTINNILLKNDTILYGDIKSHNIVKKSDNKILNQSFNDLKFYKFKERLLYKASVKSKLVFTVNEAFTSQTCSCCGCINKPGSSKIYSCKNCKKNTDRDVNAAKNILLKGIILNL